MKYTRKYILVPAEEKRTKTKPQQVKDSMKQLLKKPRNHKSAKSMSQLLKDYLHYSKKPVKKLNYLEYIPPIYHNKTKTLIQDANISWTPSGELKDLYGRPIVGSNIVDLLKKALVGSGKKSGGSAPHGWEIFIQQLAASSIPTTFFSKEATRSEIQDLRWKSF